MNIKSILTLTGLALGLSAWTAISQDAPPRSDGPPPGGPGAGPGGQRPLMPPLIRALDANADGVIDADEIAKAAEALKTLDKNGDGKLTPDEYRPPRMGGPGGPGGGPGGQGGGPGFGGERRGPGGPPPGEGQGGERQRGSRRPPSE